MSTKLFCAIVIIGICGCTKESDQGKYYTLNFTDEVFSVFMSDSVHIVVTQYGSSSIIKDSIPFLFENNESISDTIKLIMEVKFGSYFETPTPNKQVTVSGDTLFLWYASGPPPNYSLQKSSTITQVETSPKVAYYSIQSVVIKKSVNKSVTFHSKRVIQ
jgi:hypothetical protein